MKGISYFWVCFRRCQSRWMWNEPADNILLLYAKYCIWPNMTFSRSGADDTPNYVFYILVLRKRRLWFVMSECFQISKIYNTKPILSACNTCRIWYDDLPIHSPCKQRAIGAIVRLHRTALRCDMCCYYGFNQFAGSSIENKNPAFSVGLLARLSHFPRSFWLHEINPYNGRTAYVKAYKWQMEQTFGICSV